jgi:hypothetical protein
MGLLPGRFAEALTSSLSSRCADESPMYALGRVPLLVRLLCRLPDLAAGVLEWVQRKRRLNRGGDLASTGVRDRGARAEDSISPSLIRGGKQRNCERRLRSRCLITSERSPGESPRLWDDCHVSGLAFTCRSDAWG